VRIVSYQHAGDSRIGVEAGGYIVDLNRAYATYRRVGSGTANPYHEANAVVQTEVLQFLRLGQASKDAAYAALDAVLEWGVDSEECVRDGVGVPRAGARLLPPIPQPGKVICVARNYRAHAEEAGRPISDIPILFARFPSTLIATGDTIVRPRVSRELDWEGELAVIIGASARGISRAEAMSIVAGYSLFNDVTVRDYQFRVSQYTAGKNFQSSGPFGPALVTADEIEDPHDITLRTKLNGEVVQQGNTGDMIFDIPFIIEHITEFISLEPGDVIATGTPAGVGFTREPPRFLMPGDVVSVDAEQLGTLVNPVVEEVDT